MTSCDRFEREFLPEWEATGQIRHEHVRSCAECIVHYHSYQRLTAALQLDDAPALAPDWQARVQQRIRESGIAPLSGSCELGPKRKSAARTRWHVSGRRTRWLIAPFAAAAACLLWFSQTPIQSPGLPQYVVELEGGEQSHRGNIDDRSFRAGAPLSILLRPTHAVSSELWARVFVREAGLRELPVEIVWIPKGLMRLKAVVPQVGRSDQLELIVVLTTSEALARRAAAIAADSTKDGGGYRRIAVKLDVVH